MKILITYSSFDRCYPRRRFTKIKNAREFAQYWCGADPGIHNGEAYGPAGKRLKVEGDITLEQLFEPADPGTLWRAVEGITDSLNLYLGEELKGSVKYVKARGWVARKLNYTWQKNPRESCYQSVKDCFGVDAANATNNIKF